MKRWLLMAGVLFCNAAAAEIMEIQEIAQVEKILASNVSSKDWVLFDIDYTLTMPDHPALQMSTIKQNKQKFRQELSQFTDDKKSLVPLLMVTQATSILTESGVPQIIQRLKAKGAIVLGFTAADTSSMPDVGEVPKWRDNIINRLDIKFSSSADSILQEEEVVFKQFPAYRGTHPIYYRGILYTNTTSSKGAVLAAFIDYARTKPERVVLIDDSMENLESVSQHLSEKGIAFLGIHYVSQQPPKPVSDKEWRDVWDTIQRRADRANLSVENQSPRRTSQKSIKGS
jgi:hypothetical protein